MSASSDWLELVLKRDFPFRADFQERARPGGVEISWIQDGTASRPCHSMPLTVTVDRRVVSRWIEAREPEQQFIEDRVRSVVEYARLVEPYARYADRVDRVLEIRCDMVDVWLCAP